MIRAILCCIICVCCILTAQAQSYTVSGYISDADTQEILIGATILEGLSVNASTSNSYGFYSLKIPSGKVKISYGYLGYQTTDLEFDLVKDSVINIPLHRKAHELDGITVTATDYSIAGSSLGTVQVPISRIKNTTVVFGESDLMKSLHYIPGVQNSAEGKSDLSIRGGSPDQNLILLDGIPIYNANHVFGFMSVFNTDALKNVTLYKSGFPARFGGRLSSVIDINTKDGNKERYTGSATLGLLALKANIEGYIIKDRTSFTLSARRSYADFYVGKLQEWANSDKENKHDRTNFYFYDINAKIHHKLSNKTSLYLIAYNGRDRLENKTGESSTSDEISNSTTEQNWKWGNTILSTRVNHIITPNLFVSSTLAFNKYQYNTLIDKRFIIKDESDQPNNVSNSINYDSGIKDYSAAVDFEYIPLLNHYIRSGTQLIYHDFKPDVLNLKNNKESKDIGSGTIYGTEFAIYAEDEWSITNKLKLNGGFRFSLFNVNSKTYNSLAPRFSLKYSICDKLTVRAGYSLMQQYIHLLSNNSLLLQTDLWVPATDLVKPMNSKQYSLGTTISFPNLFDLSVEGYYKDMDNVIEYKDGASFSGGSTGWESKVESGKGRAYGVELSLERRFGKTNTICSYTLSKTERKFDEINYGEWFPAKFDRRHNINISITHKLSEKIDFMVNWTYASGNMMTIPLMSVVTPDIPYYPAGFDELAQLDHRNNYRMPAYHRLDVGMNYNTTKRNNRYGTWNFSIYNAYNRMNPFKLFIETDVNRDASGKNVYTQKLRQVVLFPIIPSISYTYHF